MPIVTSRTRWLGARAPTGLVAFNGASPQAAGLVGAWYFNTGTARDITGRNPAGALNATAHFAPSHETGALALTLKTTGGYVNAGAINDFAKTNEITLLSHFTATKGDAMIAMRYDFFTTGPTDAQFPYLRPGTGQSTFRSRCSQIADLATTYVHGTEGFYASTYEGVNGVIGSRNLITGQSKETNGTNHTIQSSSEPWLFATDADSSGGVNLGNWFTGQIFRIAMYDRVLDPGEMQLFYDPQTRWDLLERYGLRTFFLPSAPAGAGTTISANAGAVTVTGLAAGTGHGAAPGAAVTAGEGAGTGAGAAAASVAVTGGQATVSGPTTISANAGAVTVTGLAAGTGHGAAPGAAVTAGEGAGTGAGAAAASVAVTGGQATVSGPTTISANAGAVTVTGLAAGAGHGAAPGAAQVAGQVAAFAQLVAAGTVLVTGLRAQIGSQVDGNTGAVLVTPGRAGAAPWELGNAMLAAYQDAHLFLELGDLATADLEHFVDSDMGFGETVTYGATGFPGHFEAYNVDGDPFGGPRVRVQTAHVDAHGLTRGQTLTIRGVVYEMRAFPPDGVGFTSIILQTVT